MAVYGNTALFKEAYSIKSNIINFIEEASCNFCSFVESAFNIINEENDIIVADAPYKEIEDDIDTDSKQSNSASNIEEKVKKTFFQKVKQIFEKVIKAIKDFFKGIYNKIHDFYMNTNLKDKALSKYKDKVTYPNLQKAKENGWKGLPKSIPLPGKIWDISDSKFFEDLGEDKDNDNNLTSDRNPNKILNVIDKIMSAESEEDMMIQYKEVERLVERQKDRKWLYDDVLDMLSGPATDWNIKYFQNGDANIPLCYPGNYDKKAPYYFPTMSLFANCKKLAEEGERLQKDLKLDNKLNLKGIKDEKAVLKSFNENDKNAYKNDPLMTKKLTYKYKAQMQYVSIYYQRAFKVCQNVAKVVAIQYKYSIQGYVHFIMAITKYVLKVSNPKEA